MRVCGDDVVGCVGEIFPVVAPGEDVWFGVGFHIHAQGQTLSFTHSPRPVVYMGQVNKSFP